MTPNRAEIVSLLGLSNGWHPTLQKCQPRAAARRYDSETGRLKCRVEAHEAAVSCLALRGPSVATGGWDAVVKLWAVADLTAPDAEPPGDRRGKRARAPAAPASAPRAGTWSSWTTKRPSRVWRSTRPRRSSRRARTTGPC